MGAYNWIIALLCIAIFGCLYAITNDVIQAGFDQAYVATDEAQTAVTLIYTCWRFSPVACIAAMFAYAYMTGQKGAGT